MTKNTIYTDSEYMAQGFAAWEVPLVRESDILFNKRDEWTEAEEERYFYLVAELGL